MTNKNTASETQTSLIELAADVLMQNYRQQPMVMARGQGAELWDVAGNRYLDMTAGIAVCALGHAHPSLTRALAEQAAMLLHTSNLYFVEEQILAAKALVEVAFPGRVFFCNSGAEANEAAIKLARRYQFQEDATKQRHQVIAASGSFHGRSMATVSVTGQEKYRDGFGPLIAPVSFVPFGDLAAATAALSEQKACALIVEPVQGEGGIVVPPEGYLKGLRKACDESGTLLIFDEVQTGVGRTGRWFGHQWEGVVPDVMTMAKGLGGGFPVGAVLATEKASRGLQFMEGGAVPHATTFGGNPLACRAVRTVLETIKNDNLIENANEVGEYLAAGLEALRAKVGEPCLDVRGRGLLRGLALSVPAGPFVVKCRERGLLLSVAGGSVIRFAPALNITTAHVDEALSILGQVLS